MHILRYPSTPFFVLLLCPLFGEEALVCVFCIWVTSQACHSVFILYYTHLCMYSRHIVETHKAVYTIPRKQTLCNNKMYVALSKAFLYWLTWCLSKLFHATRWLWENTNESPSTHKGILLSPAGWGNNPRKWECGRVPQATPPDVRVDRPWLDQDTPFLLVSRG